jgi:hypothetical protein
MNSTIRNLVHGATAITLPGIALFLTCLMFVVIVGCGTEHPTQSQVQNDFTEPSSAKEQPVKSNEIDVLVRSFAQALTVFMMQTTNSNTDDAIVAG